MKSDQRLAKRQSVTVSNTTVSLLFVIGLALVTSCSAPLSPNDPVGIYVSATSGSDSRGDGSRDFPLRSISAGVDSAGSNRPVYVLPGLYDDANGEVFPIILDENIRLVSTSDGAATIRGVGTYTFPDGGVPLDAAVVSLGANVVSGFSLSSPGGAAVFLEAGSETRIENSTIEDSDFGIVISSRAEAVVDNNTISNNGDGVLVTSGSQPTITNNEIVMNGIGISVYATSSPWLGVFDSYGMNTIAENTDCDLLNDTSSTIAAVGNEWDVPIEQLSITGTCAGGNDIVSPLGTVLYEPIPNPNELVFEGETRIALAAPAENAVLSTTNPTFSWTPTNSNLVFAGIFAEPIRVSDGRIVNESDIVWVWHTGLPAGIEGSVSFSQGVRNYDSSEPPEPLQSGQSYFWAVWAWNNQGTAMTHSSPQSRFTTVP